MYQYSCMYMCTGNVVTVICIYVNNTHTHTHPFNGPFSGTTRVGRYQKGKTNLDFTEARDSEWQWRQLGHMQVCTLLQTDNHASTSPLSFLQAGCPSCRPANSVKALKAKQCKQYQYLHNINTQHKFLSTVQIRHCTKQQFGVNSNRLMQLVKVPKPSHKKAIKPYRLIITGLMFQCLHAQCMSAHSVTITQQLFKGPLSGTTRVGQHKNIHLLTPILIIKHPLPTSSIYYDP